MKQGIRIIGGRFRGKKLPVPTLSGLRPTPARVRETLFNWLMPVIQEAACLDAFAGSGALGFEAFSRGASRVVLIDDALVAFTQLTKLASDFQSTNITVLHQHALNYLQQTSTQFDIVFLDPPFATDYLAPCLHQLATTPALKGGGLVYIESPHLIEPNVDHWERLKQKRAGDVFYALYKKHKDL